MKVQFSRFLFNPVYWHIQEALNNPKYRFILVYGGSSAAKTYSAVQATIVETMTKAPKTMVLRKYATDIKDSIFSDFTGIVSNWNLDKHHHITKNPAQIQSQAGGIVRFRGLDDSEKVKGISGFKRVVMEEMNQFTHEDFKQIRKRLRGLPGQQIVGLWNPVSENHWIKNKVLDLEEWHDLPKDIEGREFSTLSDESFKRENAAGDMLLIRTTYKDNFWIVGHPDGEHGFNDIHTVNDFERDRRTDYNYYRVYALGEWGKLDTGAEFYKGFKVPVNVAPVEYDHTQPLHISLDENVNPYPALTVWQAQGKEIKQIDEICLESPRNTLKHACTEFAKRYRNHRGGLFVYGDATSRKADTKLEKGYNFFTLIKNYLEDFRPELRVPRSNPPVMIRGLFINDVFAGNIQGVSVTIGDNCKKSIEDLQYCKEDSDGTKLKEKIKDQKTGVRYEQYGHTSDTMDYFLTRFLRSEFANFQSATKTNKRLAIKADQNILY